MQINVSVDSTLLRARMNMFPKKAKYAMRDAINDTVKGAQKQQRKEMKKNFTVRSKDWVNKNVKIKPFAKFSNLEAVIAMKAPGQKRDDVLQKFESPNIKKPSGNSLAIPTENIKKKRQILAPAKKPRNLLAGAVVEKGRKKDRGKRVKSRMAGTPLTVKRNSNVTVLRARNGVYAVIRSDGKGGIFKRVGTIKKKLFQFVPRAKIKPSLKFYANVETHVKTTIKTNIDRRWKSEFRSNW